jgi:peptide/nickel transport system permease protein
MWKYVVWRFFGIIPVLTIVALFSFLLIFFTPGDPAAVMLGTEATPERIANLRTELGLDKPLIIQFKDWISKAVRGDLGRSLFLGRPVTTAILERIPITFELAITSLFIAILIGVPLGMISAVKHDSYFDRFFMFTAVLGVSLPSFWLGLLMMMFFSVHLRWLPSGGYIPFTENFVQGLKTLIMPAFSLGFMQSALIARMTRSSMLEMIRKDFVNTARAKGLKEFVINTKHVFRNITTPLITVIGLSFGNLLSGAVIVETVFAYPGLGRLIVQAVTRRDYPLIQGILLTVSVSYILVNLLTDILYPIFDPRMREN